MRYYPVFLDIKDRPVFIIGGGAVAERKALSLLSAGASVTVISPRATKGLKELAAKKSIRLVNKAYKEGMLEGAFLVMCAAGSNAVNAAAREEARARGSLVNVADDPEKCGFIVPSIVDRGSLIVAISTSGKSPALAKHLRKSLEKTIGSEYAPFVELLGEIRKKVLKSGMNNVKKERVFKELVASPIPGWLKLGAVSEINGFLKELLGKGFLLSESWLKGLMLKK